jgi:hypothetical protein
MRALVQIDLKIPILDETDSKSLRSWLESSGFSPQKFTSENEIFTNENNKMLEILIKKNQPDDVDKTFIDNISEIHINQAINILFSIPLAEQERKHALNTSAYVIHFNDHVHNMTVWGLVCVDGQTVRTRWRHHLSRTLEIATEEYVSKLWKNVGSEGIFKPFVKGHKIPIREPQSTDDAYSGEIMPVGESLKERAKEEIGNELRIGFWRLIITIFCLSAGLLLFIFSNNETWVRWLSGFFDRLATTGAATALVSYLSYYFYMRDLERKPIIDWK